MEHTEETSLLEVDAAAGLGNQNPGERDVQRFVFSNAAAGYEVEILRRLVVPDADEHFSDPDRE